MKKNGYSHVQLADRSDSAQAAEPIPSKRTHSTKNEHQPEIKHANIKLNEPGSFYFTMISL
jgi:hypothetical protein